MRLENHTSGSIISLSVGRKTFVFRVYHFHGETESSTSLRPRGSPSSQLCHRVSVRFREMHPVPSISQRMRSLKGFPLCDSIIYNLHHHQHLNRILVSWIVVNYSLLLQDSFDLSYRKNFRVNVEMMKLMSIFFF